MRKILISTILLLSLITSASALAYESYWPDTAQTLEEYYSGHIGEGAYQSTVGWTNYEEKFIGQTFQVDDMFILDRIDVKIMRFGHPGTTYLEVFNTNEGAPGDLLSQGFIDSELIPFEGQPDYPLTTFQMTSVELQPGFVYIFLLHTHNSDNDNAINLFGEEIIWEDEEQTILWYNPSYFEGCTVSGDMGTYEWIFYCNENPGASNPNRDTYFFMYSQEEQVTPNSWADVHSSMYFGQSFTVHQTHRLSNITINAFRYGLNSTVFVTLYNTNKLGKPTGNPISYGYFNSGQLNLMGQSPYWTSKWVSMSSCRLLSGKKYAFIVRVTGRGGIGLGFDQDIEEENIDINPYPFGSWMISNNYGRTWFLNSEASFWFIEG